jgi:putative ABC transport system substrate-binding protein
MMKRRTFLGAGALGLAGMAAPQLITSARAQDRPYRIYRVTYRGRTEVEDGFDDYLASNGIAVEFIERDAEQGKAKLSLFVDEIRQLKPDLVYTWGTPVTLGIAGRYDAENKQEFITDIPIVFALVASPLNAKLVADRAKPGRNLTGSVHVVPTDTQLRAMHSYRPITRLGVLYTATEQNSLSIVQELKNLQQPMNFDLIERQFRVGADGRPSPDGIEELIAEIKTEGANWLYLLPDTFLGTQYSRVSPAATSELLPTFGAAELAIRQGGALVALISRYYSVGQLAASKAAKILRKEVAVEDVPIETLKRFSLIINMPVAKKLDLYPPIDMLNYAEVLTG